MYVTKEDRDGNIFKVEIRDRYGSKWNIIVDFTKVSDSAAYRFIIGKYMFIVENLMETRREDTVNVAL